ncbi:protein POF1B [Arapaima gigas]
MSVHLTRNFSSSSSTSTSEVPLVSPGAAATYRTVNMSTVPVSRLQYVANKPAADGNVVYGTLRYLVPVEQRAVPESYMVVNGAVTNQVVSPVYVQKVPGINLAVSGVGESAHTVHYTEKEVTSERPSSVCSQSSLKSAESVFREVSIQILSEQSSSNLNNSSERVFEIKKEVSEVEPPEKLDTRFFGELLAEVYRKNCDIHTCISEHVAKIRGRKHQLDPTIDYKVENEETEALIPKGISELTKQQIRYLLQTRLTADKTLRLLLTTFSSLREELILLQENLHRLESDKEVLEKDLSFKADQALQYDRMLEALRENNRQLQVSLKESSLTQHSLETQLLETRSSESSWKYRIKEIEGSLRALEQENKLLKQKLAGQSSSSSLHLKTDELSRQYNDSLIAMRAEKDKEIESLRSQLIKIKTEYTTQTTDDRSLELRSMELLAKLDQRESIIKRQEEEIKRLQQDRDERSINVTRTVVTKKYTNPTYPMLDHRSAVQIGMSGKKTQMPVPHLSDSCYPFCMLSFCPRGSRAPQGGGGLNYEV